MSKNIKILTNKAINLQKSEDWDELCMDEEKWNLVVRKLEDSLAFNTLLLLGNKIEKHDEQKSVSLCFMIEYLVTFT